MEEVYYIDVRRKNIPGRESAFLKYQASETRTGLAVKTRRRPPWLEHGELGRENWTDALSSVHAQWYKTVSYIMSRDSHPFNTYVKSPEMSQSTG